MNAKPFNPDPLRRAHASLLRAAAEPKNEFNRDSVIQRFEYTLELAWKAMKIKLESRGITLTEPTPKGVIREAAKAGFVSDPEAWMIYVDQRNRTSHTYNEDVAESVYQSALQFIASFDRVKSWLLSV